MKFIGFWSDCKRGATKESPWPEDLIDFGWDMKERKAIVEYLGNAPVAKQSFSNIESHCLLCKCDFSYNGNNGSSDGEYFWETIFIHYVRDHGIKPDQEFINHVLEKLKE